MGVDLEAAQEGADRVREQRRQGWAGFEAGALGQVRRVDEAALEHQRGLELRERAEQLVGLVPEQLRRGAAEALRELRADQLRAEVAVGLEPVGVGAIEVVVLGGLDDCGLEVRVAGHGDRMALLRTSRWLLEADQALREVGGRLRARERQLQQVTGGAAAAGTGVVAVARHQGPLRR